ncbi:MAG TPA: hybrid sensor histidine kinase/response regulator [Gammaproteobacteria bacterium]|nr:hybrid sensor histidine kinase/response regulator [Gammaproteobacteria bacterium]
MSNGSYSDMSMFDLFRMEAEGQLAALGQGLLVLEKDPTNERELEALMRASHSLKGAARMVGVEPVVQVAHVMEDVFVAAQHQKIILSSPAIDVLLRATDLIESIAGLAEADIEGWFSHNKAQVDGAVGELEQIVSAEPVAPAPPAPPAAEEHRDAEVAEMPAPSAAEDVATAVEAPAVKTVASAGRGDERMLRINAERMSRILGVSGEMLVESRRLSSFSDSLMFLKRRQNELMEHLEGLLNNQGYGTTADMDVELRALQKKLDACRQLLGHQLASLDEYDRRNSNLSNTLYHEVTGSRMQPFAEGTAGLERMVRDLSRRLGKEVELDIRGKETLVDRDVLEKIKAPLNHLLRNAVDHGVEMPQQRLAAGKPAQAKVVVAASHGGGLLRVSIRDDGAGIDLDRLRKKIADKGLSTPSVIESLSDDELVEFLFLPDFSTRDEVTETSGRGVGLDVVHDMMRALGGTVSVENHPGLGVKFILQLPLSLSVLSALLVEIADEPYAFPLSRVDRLLSVPGEAIKVMDGRQYCELDGELIGLASGPQVLGLEHAWVARDEVSVVVLSDRLDQYGVVVDRFLGQRQLSVQPLDPRLGKVQDVSATSLMEDGSPLLILDVDDVVRSIDHIIKGGRLSSVLYEQQKQQRQRTKRVLIVDDSLTVREVERDLLESYGYVVETAVDGVDGWNALRSGDYQLVVSDVDMPRMNGIELVRAIKQDPQLRSLPVMIVSYKDRAEDRQRGLEAGADYYLAKGSFHDDTLIEAVVDLIGEARA